MRSIGFGFVLVCVAGNGVWGAEPAKGATRAVFISVPGEKGLMRVENPPDGLVARERTASTQRGMDRVTRAVNHELRDVAQALRGLDQSYAIRGFQGCGAATAGSVFIDWHAKGMRRPDNIVVLPPAPIVLGVPKHCVHCHSLLIEEEDEECDCDPATSNQSPLPPAPTPLPSQP